MSTSVIIGFGIPVHVFLTVHPFGKCFGHLVGIVVVILAIHRLADVDPDLLSVKTVERMRMLLSSGPDLISACDINGNKGNPSLYGEVRSTVLKFSELTGVGSCSFREDKADVALFDFLLSLDEASYGVAVTVNGDAAAYAHDKTAETAVLGLEVGSCKAAHPFKMALRKIVDDKDAVGIALVVGSNDIRVVLWEILFPDALHVTEDVSEKKESVLCDYVPETSFGRVFLVKRLMVLGVCSLMFRSVSGSGRNIIRFDL